MIRLSICIATLNRAGFIGETLYGILEQMTDEVELVVVDGASTDGTDRIVCELFTGRINCHYHRLPEKGGVDLDYCRAVDRAVGEFCWLMTDDDILKPGAVHKVLSNLGDDLDLLMVNAEVANIDLSQTLMPKRVRIDGDREFGPAEQAELLAVAGDLLSFIATVVIRRSTWLIRDTKPYLGTEFVHVGVIFQRPFERKARALAEPLIRQRLGNSQWTARTFDIWMFKWPGLIWSFPHLPDEAKRSVVSREPYRRITPLVNMKIHGCFNFRAFRTKLAWRQLGFFGRIFAATLAAFPEVPFNAIMSLLVAPLIPSRSLVRFELARSPYSYRKRWFGRNA